MFCNKNIQSAPILQKRKKKPMEFPDSIYGMKDHVEATAYSWW